MQVVCKCGKPATHDIDGTFMCCECFERAVVQTMKSMAAAMEAKTEKVTP